MRKFDDSSGVIAVVKKDTSGLLQLVEEFLSLKGCVELSLVFSLNGRWTL